MIKQQYHYKISYKKAWLEKQLAKADLYVDWDASYRLLPKWMAAFYVSHLASNFNTTFKNKELKTMVYSMAIATQQIQFDKLWEKIKGVEEVHVAEWLNNISHDRWTLLDDQRRRWEHMTKNMVEIFNSVLKGARGLPITALV
ncbi:hypothetical protein CFOL_v3_27833 [Cephalotus follicularis]|uniref:Uncharacterized protein n=1 Tax=Cephalotus follicularis TaxID=3775 RepID=A0A1Q3CVY0_CEPFO|nr:hypothetical protein CFOL_v3_27833 [Cephalotus follicularis]